MPHGWEGFANSSPKNTGRGLTNRIPDVSWNVEDALDQRSNSLLSAKEKGLKLSWRSKASACSALFKALMTT